MKNTWINEWGIGKTMEQLVKEDKEKRAAFEKFTKANEGKKITYDPFLGWITK